MNSINEHGNTALHYACFWGYGDLADDLVAKFGALVFVTNRDGDTPLDKSKGGLSTKLHGKLRMKNDCKLKILRHVCMVCVHINNLVFGGSCLIRVVVFFLPCSVLSTSFLPVSKGLIWLLFIDRAVEAGQDLKKIPYKDQSWLGLKTHRSRKRISFSHLFLCTLMYPPRVAEREGGGGLVGDVESELSSHNTEIRIQIKDPIHSVTH